MSVETLAEVICNEQTRGDLGAVPGDQPLDPNNDEDWTLALADAREQIDAAARGELDPWWEGE